MGYKTPQQNYFQGGVSESPEIQTQTIDYYKSPTNPPEQYIATGAVGLIHLWKYTSITTTLW